MTPSSPKGMLLNAMKGKMLKSFKEAVGSHDITTENMEEESLIFVRKYPKNIICYPLKRMKLIL